MRVFVRRAAISLVVLTVAIVLVGSFGWWSIHTAWFASLVRSRIVSTLQKTTGGKVEMGDFSFNPDTLHVRISRLVIHGTEPVGSAALLSVDEADIGLKILSLWHQDVDVESVTINRPAVHLMVSPDGSSNIPTPKRRRSQDPIEQLLDLKAKRLEVNQGMLEINDKRLPFAFNSQGIGLVLDYKYDGPSYGVALDANAVNVLFFTSVLKPMRITSKARLFRDHADIENLVLVTDKSASTIQLSGQISHFAQPVAHANVQASLSIDELAQLATINDQLRDGRIGVTGVADFSAESNKFIFKGDADARGVAFVSPAFTLRNMNATAQVIANNNGMLLKRAHADARGAHFSGEGSIKAYRFLEVAGQVSQIALSEVGSYLTSQPFPWSGSAHGQAHASAKLGAAQPDFIIGAKVDIDAGESGIPTSGNVDVTYFSGPNKVEFGASALNLPHTKGSFQGTLDTDLLLTTETTDLADIQPLSPILGARIAAADLPKFAASGSGHFQGVLHDVVDKAMISGDVSLSKFKFRAYDYDSISGQATLRASEFSISKFQVQQAGASASGNASARLKNWLADNNSDLQLNSRFTNVDVAKAATLVTTTPVPIIRGVASGSIALHGSINNPRGSGTFQISNLDAFGEQLNQAKFNAVIDGNRLQLNQGRVQSGEAVLNFSGDFKHNSADWSTGDIDVKADTNGFPLASLSTIKRFVPALNGRAEFHLDAVGKLRRDSFEPLKVDGSADFQHVQLNGRELGNVSLASVTQGNNINFKYSGGPRDAKFHGAAQAQLTTGTPIRGEVQIDRISLATAKALAYDAKLSLPLDGFLDGGIVFDGLLEEPARMHARATIQHLEISSLPRQGAPDIALRNNEPILIDVSDGTLNISKFEIDGRDTGVKITGSAPFLGGKPMDIKAVGNADLALFMLFDPNVRSSGTSELAANISGPITAPNITGALKIRNGSFFLSDIPNGLSDVNGAVVFSRNRATIQKMTAHSGGGDISLGGTLSFGEGNPLVYHLEAAARNVRVRYANSISVTGNSDLRLSGTSASGLLSGTLTVTRVVFTPNADAGNLLAAASSLGTVATNPDDFISGLHLDVVVESAPNLQVSTNLSRDVEAEIQLRLRGTPDHPVVLGSITANQGDIKIFGTRFSLNRGEVSFVNTVRVEPVLDLDLETQARGVTVDITVSGAPSKLNFNYRSDPPLQPRDIIALLTVGRAPNTGTTSNAQGASDVSALSSGVNSVLGQAVSPVSNRLSKLFGITNIKIDPFVQGITNTPQARLSVEQQISRDVTVTYITNLSQTSEQIFRFEWALNRQFAIVAIRDDNGEFGVDFQYKKRFK